MGCRPIDVGTHRRDASRRASHFVVPRRTSSPQTPQGLGHEGWARGVARCDRRELTAAAGAATVRLHCHGRIAARLCLRVERLEQRRPLGVKPGRVEWRRPRTGRAALALTLSVAGAHLEAIVPRRGRCTSRGGQRKGEHLWAELLQHVRVAFLCGDYRVSCERHTAGMLGRLPLQCRHTVCCHRTKAWWRRRWRAAR